MHRVSVGCVLAMLSKLVLRAVGNDTTTLPIVLVLPQSISMFSKTNGADNASRHALPVQKILSCSKFIFVIDECSESVVFLTSVGCQ